MGDDTPSVNVGARLVRRAEAWRLARERGLSRYAFDLLVGEGCVARVKVVGGRDHYRLDKLVELFERGGEGRA